MKDLYEGTINAQHMSLKEWKERQESFQAELIIEDLEGIILNAVRARGKEKIVKIIIFRCGVDETFTITKDKR